MDGSTNGKLSKRKPAAEKSAAGKFKWFDSAFSSGFYVLKNELMLFTFQRSYVNLKRREPWLLEKGR